MHPPFRAQRRSPATKAHAASGATRSASPHTLERAAFSISGFACSSTTAAATSPSITPLATHASSFACSSLPDSFSSPHGIIGIMSRLVLPPVPVMERVANSHDASTPPGAIACAPAAATQRAALGVSAVLGR